MFVLTSRQLSHAALRARLLHLSPALTGDGRYNPGRSGPSRAGGFRHRGRKEDRVIVRERIPAQERTWEESIPTLKFNYQVRGLVREEQYVQKQASGEAERSDPRGSVARRTESAESNDVKTSEAWGKEVLAKCGTILDVNRALVDACRQCQSQEQLNEYYDQCGLRFRQLVLEVSESELVEAVSVLSGTLLPMLGVSIAYSPRLPSLSAGCRSVLISKLCRRGLASNTKTHLTHMCDQYLKDLTSSVSSFSREQLLTAVHGLSLVKDVDCSALISTILSDMSPDHVSTLSDEELRLTCFFVSRKTSFASPELMAALRSKFESRIDELKPDALVRMSFHLSRDQSVSFDTKILAKLDKICGGVGLENLSDMVLCNLAQVFLQHVRVFLPVEANFGKQLQLRMSRLMDWQMVMLARTSIVSWQMTSQTMKAIIEYLSSGTTDRFYLTSPTSVGFFLSALLFHDQSLPEANELARTIVRRVNFKSEAFSPRDAIHILRDLLRLDAAKEHLHVALLLDVALEDMMAWRIIDLCALLESACMMKATSFVYQSRRLSSFLYDNAHRFHPVVRPHQLSQVVNSCRYIADMQWTTCPWLETFVPFITDGLDTLLYKNVLSGGLVSHTFSNIASLQYPLKPALTVLSSAIEQRRVGALFTQTSHQIHAIWACAVQGVAPANELHRLVERCQYERDLAKFGCVPMMSQLVAMTRIYDQQPAPAGMVQLLKQVTVHRPVSKCISLVKEIVGEECVASGKVAPEGLLLDACLLLDSAGTAVPWNGAGIDADFISAKEILKRGFVPLVLMPLEERHHSADRKQLMALPQKQCELLEQFNWSVVTISLPAIRIALVAEGDRNSDALYRTVLSKLLRKAGVDLPAPAD